VPEDQRSCIFRWNITKDMVCLYLPRYAICLLERTQYYTAHLHFIKTEVSLSVMQNHRATTYSFQCSTPLSHSETYEYCMESKQLTCIQSHSIKGVDNTKFDCTQLNVKSGDGVTNIPVTLIHSKAMKNNSE
jgi:protease II